MAELLPCPFCGNENIQWWETDSETNRFQIVCMRCFNGTDECRTEKIAIEKWNTRKPMERIVEQLEEEIDPYYFLEPSWETREVRTNKHKGFCDGICKAIKIVKGGVDNAE
jgi:Lar family restriction alleviation protein